MLKILIVDDEFDAQVILKQFLFNYFPEIELVGMASSIESARELLKLYNPDIVLLDIQLRANSGFELLTEDEADRNFEVIFTTAHSEYAIKAFKVNAADYLLKPIDPLEFKHAINKSVDRINSKNHLAKLNEEITKYSINQIAIPTRSSHYIANLKDIIRCEAEGNYTRFFMHDRNALLVSKTLKSFEELLEKNGFIRVHQSHLVNMIYFEQFNVDNNTVILQNKEVIPVSRRKKKNVIDTIRMRLQ